MKRVTVKQFAADQNVAPATANTILAFLRAKGLVKVVDSVHKETPNGKPVKGKSANVFEIPETVTIAL